LIHTKSNRLRVTNNISSMNVEPFAELTVPSHHHRDERLPLLKLNAGHPYAGKHKIPSFTTISSRLLAALSGSCWLKYAII
jgi:hypothetical protein